MLIAKVEKDILLGFPNFGLHRLDNDVILSEIFLQTYLEGTVYKFSNFCPTLLRNKPSGLSGLSDNKYLQPRTADQGLELMRKVLQKDVKITFISRYMSEKMCKSKP